MRGFPKHVNNRNDLDHLRELYPSDTKKYIDTIVSNRSIWVSTGIITDDGITDDTHKVIISDDTISGVSTKYQYELVDNLPPIIKLEFTSYDDVIEYSKGI